MAIKETEAITKDNLFSATQIMPVVSDVITLGAAATRGALVTSAGALVTDSTAANVYAVVAEDGASGDSVPCYLTGEFSSAAVQAATGLASMPAALVQAARKIGIFIKTNA